MKNVGKGNSHLSNAYESKLGYAKFNGVLLMMIVLELQPLTWPALPASAVRNVGLTGNRPEI